MFESELTRNLGVFFIGILVIFAGIFLAKKMKVFNGLMLSSEDRNLLEKTKKALGMSPSNPGPNTSSGQHPY